MLYCFSALKIYCLLSVSKSAAGRQALNCTSLQFLLDFINLLWEQWVISIYHFIKLMFVKYQLFSCYWEGFLMLLETSGGPFPLTIRELWITFWVVLNTITEVYSWPYFHVVFWNYNVILVDLIVIKLSSLSVCCQHNHIGLPSWPLKMVEIIKSLHSFPQPLVFPSLWLVD